MEASDTETQDKNEKDEKDEGDENLEIAGEETTAAAQPRAPEEYVIGVTPEHESELVPDVEEDGIGMPSQSLDPKFAEAARRQDERMQKKGKPEAERPVQA